MGIYKKGRETETAGAEPAVVEPRMTNVAACNKGAWVHRKKRMSVPLLSHLSNAHTESS